MAPGAPFADDGHVVGGEDQDLGLADQPGQLGPRALAMKAASPARNHSSISSTSRLHHGRHGEGQPHLHAGGIGADRHVEELAEAGEGADLLGQRLALGLRQAAEQAAQDDVLPPRRIPGPCRRAGRSARRSARPPPAARRPARRPRRASAAAWSCRRRCCRPAPPARPRPMRKRQVAQRRDHDAVAASSRSRSGDLARMRFFSDRAPM